MVALGVHWWSAFLGQKRAGYPTGAPLRILQVQISVVFLWATYAKLNTRFMSGAVLSVSFLGPVPPPEFVLNRSTLAALAVLTVVVEAFLGIALWIDTLRRPALVVASLFHLFILAMFGPGGSLGCFRTHNG